MTEHPPETRPAVGHAVRTPPVPSQASPGPALEPVRQPVREPVRLPVGNAAQTPKETPGRRRKRTVLTASQAFEASWPVFGLCQGVRCRRLPPGTGSRPKQTATTNGRLNGRFSVGDAFIFTELYLSQTALPHRVSSNKDSPTALPCPLLIKRDWSGQATVAASTASVINYYRRPA
ncbi:hypothetical protein Bbelb_444480 [Branchiostoma belcheri]|nr:hypothetical protein Bbelb_444480 [Branchiostoma belcheri]